MRFSSLLSFCILTLFWSLIVDPAAAQHIEAKEAWPADPAGAASARSDDGAIHVSDILLATPEGRRNLEAYFEARAAGLIELGKHSSVTDTVGQQRDFNVQTNLLVDSTRTWESMNFTLRATNEIANVWVETDLDGSFSDAALSELQEYILEVTPEDSYRPDRGIIANDNEIFGAPPNVDGDGAVDILLHDIIEGEGMGCCVLGYVTSADLNLLMPPGEGNKRDVLYVDLPDGLNQAGVIGMAGTIAHEYQHLIHFGYRPEDTFINEGLSEWAEVMNGFFLRTINYLTKTDEHNTPLLEFRLNEPISVRENDYQRAGLFTTYIADRIGWEATGSIVQAKKPGSTINARGAEGYEVVLDGEGLTLTDVIADFHAANFINDEGVDSRFGYALPQRQTFSVIPTTRLDGASATTASTSFSIRAGAVHYVHWTDVADLQLTISLDSGTDADLRTRFRIYAEGVDGSRDVVSLESDAEEHVLDGDHKRVTLIAANVDLETFSAIHYTIESEWSPGSSAFVEETLAYDDGDLLSPVYIGQPSTARQATRFPVPDGASLASVSVAPVWDNQFQSSGVPSGLPRDFTVFAWADDGTGLPGEELFAREIVESPTTSHVGESGLLFLTVDVSDESGLSSGLPDTLYIGIGNAGTDSNVLSLATSTSSSEENVSYLYYPFQDGLSWAPFSAITSDGEAILEGKVVPIRAQFIVPTAGEDPAELPSALTLEQNFPNPFNPTTSILFNLPRPAHVRLAVYDAIGRQVAVLVDGSRPAGAHSAQVDATGWSSGVYFYRLETDGASTTRQMILLK